jgi:amino acid adenylation domain-containing protein
MLRTRALHESFAESALAHGERTAIVEPGRAAISYRELDLLSDRLRDRLLALGVRRGDRVAIYQRKSIDAIASILGILKAGAAYVPVDPSAPPARGAYIAHNCAVSLVLIERRFAERFRAESEAAGGAPPMFGIGEAGGGEALREALDAADRGSAAPAGANAPGEPDDLAYILYTSGSTGRPKGVMLSHGNAVSFVDWCSEVFAPTAADRFSAHAPLHFDLSILDIHVALKHGATLVLISEGIGKEPQQLADLIEAERITIWYSAPSILALLAQFGRLAERDFSSLRTVLFAGEVFAVKHLRRLTELLPAPRYYNLYGPTETNVCTWYEVRLPVPPERSVPYPIGRVCSHLAGKVVDEQLREVPFGAEGELLIAGSGVMQGYWALPEQTAHGFIVDDSGTRWYRTGDIVVESRADGYIYRGRRDRMVKRRGYRVELGEIEAALYRHPQIKEAAVVARSDDEAGVTISAFIACADGRRLSLIEIKRFCAEQLPLYMIPDRFSWHEALPKTSTDKIDYQRLKELA